MNPVNATMSDDPKAEKVMSSISLREKLREEAFVKHVALMTAKHPAWQKGNNHGATSLLAVAREFWDAAYGEPVWKRCADELPDDKTTVLVALYDGEVWTGFRDAGRWRFVSADLIECEVTHWMDFPAPPISEESA